MYDLPKRIEACIAIENTVAEIYKEFSNMFPEAKAFFQELSKEEEDHATILSVAKAYHKVGKLPERVVPGPLPDIAGTLDRVGSIRERIRTDKFTLKEAMDIAAEIEGTVAEKYLQETLMAKTDDRVIANLRKLMHESQTHGQRVREFRAKLGV